MRLGRYEPSLTAIMAMLQLPVSIEDQGFADSVCSTAQPLRAASLVSPSLCRRLQMTEALETAFAGLVNRSRETSQVAPLSLLQLFVSTLDLAIRHEVFMSHSKATFFRWRSEADEVCAQVG